MADSENTYRLAAHVILSIFGPNVDELWAIGSRAFLYKDKYEGACVGLRCDAGVCCCLGGYCGGGGDGSVVGAAEVSPGKWTAYCCCLIFKVSDLKRWTRLMMPTLSSKRRL